MPHLSAVGISSLQAGEDVNHARELADRLADGPPLVFAAIKEVSRECESLPFGEALRRITERRLPTVDRLYGSEDQREGARAFAEKRKPQWRGR